MGPVRIRLVSRRFLPGALVLAAGVAAAALGLAAYETHLLRFLELDTVDARFTVRGKQTPPSDLVIVAIDDDTFNDLRLPWRFPRSLHARVIRRLAADGARVIAYDI